MATDQGTAPPMNCSHCGHPILGTITWLDAGRKGPFCGACKIKLSPAPLATDPAGKLSILTARLQAVDKEVVAAAEAAGFERGWELCISETMTEAERDEIRLQAKGVFSRALTAEVKPLVEALQRRLDSIEVPNEQDWKARAILARYAPSTDAIEFFEEGPHKEKPR